MFPLLSSTMYPVAADWARLGREVVAARVALGYNNREQLANAAGFSTRLLGDIERARRDNYDVAYLARLEHALCWATGSVDQVLAGGHPTPVGEQAGVPADPDDQETEFEIRVIEQSSLPDKQKQAMVRYARDLQRRQRADRDQLRERQRADRRAQLQAMLDVARGDNNNAQPAT